ncbi:MAG TPA: DUF2304 domain-containing protein [Negativicutes bacterium]|nr:DUF2304 domain-containing protein [Negativicutes bacterium]
MTVDGSFDKIQWLGIVFSLIILLSVIFLVRERLLKEKYALIWILIGLFTLLISLCRGLLDGFSDLIGVYYAPSAFFSLLIACAYLLLLNMSVSLSGLKAQNKAVSQELGLLKLRLEELEKEVGKTDKGKA